MKNLEELTGQESGIVIYTTKEGILCNWSSIKGLPKLFVTGVFGLGEEIEESVPTETADCRDEIDGVDLIYSEQNDTQFSEEFKNAVPAKIYELSDGTKIIAPEGWS